MPTKKDPQRLVWIDLEMTGLEPEKHVIIEIASLVTDGDLNVIAEGPNLAIARSAADLAKMDAWNVGTHTGSGLVERIKASTIDVVEAEQQTLAFIRRWVAKGMSPLAGNSIAQDRRFLRREMPKLDAYLHYRNVDVSTLKELTRRWYPAVTPPEKKQAHRALDDILESVEELRWYRSRFFLPPEALAPPEPSEGDPPAEAPGP
ncbi:MAG: oligoribonuclease [Chloroflexi bacterium]|nr:oligoribonuclease [Chloroflexota bacterium]MDA1241480.1 oligoribonuclease [Chloroflexota bacterium]MQC25542.1 oligoribonuclease [Chloroflexota bacterium]